MRVSAAIIKHLEPLIGNRKVWPNGAPEAVAYPLVIYVEANREPLNT